MQITRSTLDTAKGPNDWFTGEVYIDAVAAAPQPSRVRAAGARSCVRIRTCAGPDE
jgi:hypothetical protein